MSAPSLQSCLYEGVVRHQRFKPFQREFRYRLFLVYLDLSELDRVFRGSRLWSTTKPALAQFRRSDHLGDSSRPLDECVRDLVEERTGRRPLGPIRLLTHLRYFGYIMNPVSFYYCFDADGAQVQAVVAEVNNTPWGERHCYVLRREPTGAGKLLRASHPKEFHVSPFLPMNMEYQWTLSAPGDRLLVHIDDCREGSPDLRATMLLKRRAISPSSLAGTLARYPLMTLRVIAAIYWQAFLLWCRRAAYFPHPHALPQSMTPHASNVEGAPQP